MKLKHLLAVALMAIGGSAWAQTPSLKNANFAEGNVGDVNIATYAKDGTPNQMQEVPEWTIGVENGDARAAGVVAYGSGTTLGGAAYTVPSAGPEGTNGNALAVVGVWTGTVKYVQDVELPAGKYTMTVPVYNTAGTTAFVKNLIGVTIDGAETLAAATTYPVGQWTNEIVVFELAEDATVTVSLGYEGANVGSGAAQHLFYDCVKIEEYVELDVAKAAAIAALPVGDESLFTPSAEDVAEVKAAIEAATTVAKVEKAAATVASLSIPALSGSWAVLNATNGLYLGAAVLSADATTITFAKAENGFYIKVGEEYLNMAGGNTWSMNTAAEANTVWNFTLTDGKYTIKGPNGLIGTDGTNAGDATYGNKGVGNNGYWTIVDPVAAAIKSAKTALKSALDSKPAITTNIGDGAFQYPAAGIEAMISPLEAAQAVYGNENATLEEINIQISAVNALEIPTLNAPAAGKKFDIVLTYNGWTYDNKAITYIANGREDMGNYNIQYLAEANGNYAQAFTMTQVEGNKYKMSQIDADGVERFISTGVVHGGNNAQIRTTTEAEEALVVEVIPTAKEGVYNLKNTEANQYIGSQDEGVFTINSHIDFKIVEAAQIAGPSISAAGYSTYVAPVDAAIPAGAKAYTVSAVEGTLLTLTEVNTIAANTVVILEGSEVASEGLGYANVNPENATVTTDLLTGVYEATEAPADSYVLQNNEGKVGFYHVGETKPTVGANRAYLTVPSAEEAKPRAFYFDAETAIATIEALTSGKAEIYNMNGVKINALQKGINIVNGKKILVK